MSTTNLNREGAKRREGSRRIRADSSSRLFALLRAFAVAFVLFAFTATASADMRRYETEHYFLNTDVDRELANDLVRRMDAMFEEYARRLVEFAPPQSESKLTVYVYSNRADYVKFTKSANSSGVFIPSRKILAATLEGQGRDGLRRTLQHEAFHQFAFSAIGPEIPLWLNEGLACVFEEGIYNGNQFALGQVPPWRLR